METKIPNPNTNNRDKKKKKMEFEFCKICKLNHDRGRRHNYIPNHTKSLSSFLSRFLKKLSDVRFFLKNPTLLRPEHASRNRLWCVFCDSDIDELGSLFVCNNAIRHLASPEHLKSLKDFLWKYGGGMDRVDSFRVSDTDLTQWEKKCKTLENASPLPSGRTCGPLVGDLKDIHDNTYYDNLDNFERNRFHSFDLSISNGLLPLQKFTNEKIQVSHRKVSEVANVGPRLHETSSWPVSTHNSIGGNQVGGLGNGESSNQVLQTLTQVPPLLSQESEANVHSGAPPPWFEKAEATQLTGPVSTGYHKNGTVSSKKSGKSQKLNPNRVGAAWAEKRKVELEMEKRGEAVTNICDANWLPNFGRVWHAGSRKESRKEFERQNDKPIETNSFSEMPIQIQPYVSKRMNSLISFISQPLTSKAKWFAELLPKTIVWGLWKERNRRIFEGKTKELHKIFIKVKEILFG